MIGVGMPLLRCCWGCIEPERTYTYEGDMSFACRSASMVLMLLCHRLADTACLNHCLAATRACMCECMLCVCRVQAEPWSHAAPVDHRCRCLDNVDGTPQP
jgi:hypothetical protein